MFALLKIIILCFATPIILAQVLSSANLASNVMRSNWRVSGNSIGLSMDFEEIIPNIENILFQKYHKNSFFYGDWGAIFQQTCHVRPGTRYKCQLIANYTNSSISNCQIELNNETLLNKLGQYIWNYTNFYAFIIGWDMKDTNFSNSSYLTNIFSNFVLTVYKKANYQPFIIQMVDKGDKYGEIGYNPNYTAKKLVKDCKSVNNNLYGVIMSGPGATQNATKQWYTQNKDIYWYCGLFSYRAYVFQNSQEMLISNLLSETYTSLYWSKRFNIEDVNVLSDFDQYLGMINDFRIVQDPKGVDGFTNTFAAAIFMIEATLQYFYLGGFYISYFNPILEHSFQSPYGQAPKFAPSSLYYSLLFLSLSTRRYPFIERPNTVSGTSKSIKVYGLRYYGTNYGVIIINKDQNVNTTGVVQIALRDNSGLTCLYLQADSLNATDGITFAGVSFISGNATYQGNFTATKYGVNANNNYEIKLNYSQVVFCKTDAVISTYPFPRGSNNYQSYYYLSLLLILIIIVQ